MSEKTCYLCRKVIEFGGDLKSVEVDWRDKKGRSKVTSIWKGVNVCFVCEDNYKFMEWVELPKEYNARARFV